MKILQTWNVEDILTPYLYSSKGITPYKPFVKIVDNGITYLGFIDTLYSYVFIERCISINPFSMDTFQKISDEEFRALQNFLKDNGLMI